MDTIIDTNTFSTVHPVLMGYAQRAVRQHELARDLVQETWLAGARHLGSFDGRASFRTWMVGILKHKIIDHFRRADRELGIDVELVSEPENDAHLDWTRALAVVRDELHRLPELQRRAVELCDVQGVSRDEAAQCLGVERGHLRVLLHRGRNRLREALQAAGVTL
jgi:RNA polymerase sigma-70 factor (ECF subfamily)